MTATRIRSFALSLASPPREACALGSSTSTSRTTSTVSVAAPTSASASSYREDQAKVRAYARNLGLTYVCNDARIECEIDALPSPTSRAAALESAMQMVAAYKIYSGAAHAEWHSVVQGWRQAPSPDEPHWERQPDREAVWAMVLSAAGLATMAAFRTLTLLGWNARLVELSYSMRRLDEMTRRMKLPHEWAY